MSIMDLANNPILAGTTGQMIGYIETESSETLSLKLYNFLIETIRQADSTREGTLFVKRLFDGPQNIWQLIQNNIFALKGMTSITDCPDELLIYLKWIVGWTSELDNITNELDNDTLRRLISASAPLWKRRGQETAVTDILSLIFSVRCVIWNWFDYRWIIDETEFGEQHQGRDPWIIGDSSSPYFGEYQNTLRIVDDGSLNSTLTKDILKLMRPCCERFEVVYLDFLDRFLTEEDNTQWEAINGDEIIVQNGYASLEDSSAQLSIASTDSSLAWTRYILYCRIKGVETTGSYGVVFYYVDSDNYYELVLNIDSSGNDYELNKVISGTPTNITSGNFTQQILPDTWYGIRIHIDEDSSQNRIRMYLDGDEAFNLLDTSSLDEGTFGIFSDASVTVRFNECELFQLPLSTELIDINS